MPISDRFSRLPLDSIQVARDDRQRRELKVEDLADSIRRNGVLQPIIVDSRPDGLWLLVGERRLEACRLLGLPDIPVRFAADLDPIERQLIELEENVKRKDLEWKEIVQALAKIHALHQERDPEWTMTQTAEACGLGLSHVSMCLRVHESAEDPRVQAAGTIREAYNLLVRRDSRVMGEALGDLLDGSPFGTEPGPEQAPAGAEISELTRSSAPAPGPSALTASVRAPEPAPPVLCLDFLQWASQYSGPKFSLIHCDFPYGINLFAGPQGLGAEPGSGYSDHPELYFQLLDSLCRNLDRLMSVSAHLMFWYSEKHGEATRRVFASLAPQLKFTPFPLVWLKSDNTGIASDYRHGPRHVYETCFLASRGARQIVRVVADGYSSPTDKRLHPSAKPEPMLRHFMTMLVDESTALLDPTCGSGTALRAADSLGARTVLGLEKDPGFASAALRELKTARSLRVASKVVGP